MDLLAQSYELLYPGRACPYETHVRYDAHFKGFNGNIRLSGKRLVIKLSKNWKGVSPHIQIGMMQELLCRLLKRKTQTLNMEVYHNFLRSVHWDIPKTKSHPALADSFARVNSQYFLGMLEKPNLVVGDSLNPIGTYTYGTDTIMISRHLLRKKDLLDYVMHHEMLHKKHKFSASKGNRTSHHSKAFKADEARFKNAHVLEKDLGQHLRSVARQRRQRKRFFGLF